MPASHPGAVSAGIRAGAGIGQVFGLNCEWEENPYLLGDVGPVFLISPFLGVRLAEHYRVAVEFDATHFSDLRQNAPSPIFPNHPIVTGLSAWGLGVAFSLEWVER